jgi:SpoVK/Ycf46/Vps4 family AAA+-type ATPase
MVIAQLGECETEPSDEEVQQIISKSLFEACKAQVRPDLDNLAERLQTDFRWDDIILAPKTLRGLQQIASHVQNRVLVYETWGLLGSSSRGTGTSVLFSGPSGTGKTMAAEVLASELNLDLYRIDLSAVVSKYIGETEKNLSRIFDAAENGGVALLFDEADSLFGKRSDVKDARDRHANIEVSYLLQRLESFRGLAILTSNLKDSIDHAFLRRIRYVVDFPFPDSDARAEIWRRMLTGGIPLDELDYLKLARLNIAGGTIRNIVLTGASMAAADPAASALHMHHLRDAARSEFSKSEHPLPTRLVGDW